jgi:hypothetical protein
VFWREHVSRKSWAQTGFNLGMCIVVQCVVGLNVKFTGIKRIFVSDSVQTFSNRHPVNMNARPRHVVASCHLDRRDEGHAVANRSTGCRSWPAVSMFALSCFGRVLQLFVLNVVH